ERLRQRVLEGAPAPRRQRSRKRKLVLVVLPAAVVLAVGAALVHGFVSSGSRPINATAKQIRLNPRVYGPATVTGSGTAVHGVAQTKSGQSQNGAFSSQRDSAAVTSAPQAL